MEGPAPASPALSPQAADRVGGFVSAAGKKAQKRHRRNNIIAVCVTGVIVFLSLFWIFAFRLYTVTSNSMAPALMGMPGKRDRLLCWRLAYLFRQPKRWEIAIFRAPANAADREIMPGIHTGGESGTTVKRLVGMPGERLAIAAGDIWTASPDTGRFRRQVKPDAIQRGMWIGVYDEDFTDLSTEEFLYFWNGGGDVEVNASGVLRLGEGARLEYLPKARVGQKGEVVGVLPGIPDRYILPQDAFYICGDPECRAEFQSPLENQKIQARCPVCGLMNHEDSIGFYSYRSGLPEIGPYAVGTVGGFQGDTRNFRTNSYHFVRDLRLVVEWRPIRDGGLDIAMNRDGRPSGLRLFRDRAEFGDAVVAVPAVRGSDEWIRTEFQIVDGAARLFGGEERVPLLDIDVGAADLADARHLVRESGIMLAAVNGGASVRRIIIDRDVHYYGGGWRQNNGYYPGIAEDVPPWEIPDGMFLPLGDNATVSLDGRLWGPVPTANLQGSVLLLWSQSKT